MTEIDISSSTHVHIQTDLGQYQFWADRWEIEVQDDGRSVFLRGRGTGKYAKYHELGS